MTYDKFCRLLLMRRRDYQIESDWTKAQFGLIFKRAGVVEMDSFGLFGIAHAWRETMKPQLRVDCIRSLSHYERCRLQHRSLLNVNCFFQAPRFGGRFEGDGSPWRRPNFTGLAKEVLRADASRSFRIEAAVLGLISLVAAWPVIMMIREVIRILRY